MREFGLKFISLILFILLLVSCATPSIKTKALMPAEINLKGYKNVAVLDFEGQGTAGHQISSWLEAALLKTKVAGKPYFKIISRTQLNKVINEQKLQMTGLADPETTKKLGRILGLDAIISGSVDGWEVEDGDYTEERSRSVITYGNKYVTQKYYVKCTNRRSYVSFTVNFIDVETATIEISEPVSYQKEAAACGGARNTQLPPRSQLLKNSAQEAVHQFVNKISPHYEWVKLDIKTKDDSAGAGSFDIPFLSKVSEDEKAKKKIASESFKNGCNYAKMGDFKNALKQFQKFVGLKPDSPAGNYNLGVVYEAKGELQKAKESYEKAANLKADASYTQAVSSINSRIAKQEELNKQVRE